MRYTCTQSCNRYIHARLLSFSTTLTLEIFFLDPCISLSLSLLPHCPLSGTPFPAQVQLLAERYANALEIKKRQVRR